MTETSAVGVGCSGPLVCAVQSNNSPVKPAGPVKNMLVSINATHGMKLDATHIHKQLLATALLTLSHKLVEHMLSCFSPILSFLLS